MNDGLFCDTIENQKAKEFINGIPSYVKVKCKIKKFEKEKIIVLKGNYLESIFISCEGKIQVINEFENGFLYSFASIEPLAYIGIMEMMANEKTYSSTLQAITDCILIEISKDDFFKWINNDQRLTLDVLQFVSKSMYEQSIKKGEVLAYPAICTLISYLINVFESEDKDVVFLEKTREEISSILGFSVRTINRNLKVLKEENLISVTRKDISITKEQFFKLSKKLYEIK